MEANRSGDGAQRITFRLGPKITHSSRFSPLTPPRELSLELGQTDARLIDRLDLTCELGLRAGSHNVPMFRNELLPVDIPKGCRCHVRLVAARQGDAADNAALVNHAELEFTPPVTIRNLLPVLAELPSLFKDRDLAQLLGWLARARDARVAGIGLRDLRDLAGRLVGWPFGGAERRGGERLDSELKSLKETLGTASRQAAYVVLRRVVFERVRRGNCWHLEPRFSGDLWCFDRIPYKFDAVHLPPQVIPSLDASLDRLLSIQPLATASWRGQHPAGEPLADALVNLVSSIVGKVEAEARLPEVAINMLLPDRGTLAGSAQLLGTIQAKAAFHGEVARDLACLTLDNLELQQSERSLVASGEVRLEVGDSAARGVGGWLHRCAGERRWLSESLGLVVALRLERGSHLPDLAFDARVNHPLVRGDLALRARLSQLILDGEAALEWPAGIDRQRTHLLDLRFTGQGELLDGARLDDGPTRLESVETRATFVGDIDSRTGQSAALRIDGTANFGVRGKRVLAAFPELSLEDGDLTFETSGLMNFGVRAQARKLDGDLVEVDGAGTSCDLTLERVLLELGARNLTLPTGSQVRFALREAVLAASGLGRATIDVGWDLQGQSPLLRHGHKVVELFVPNLRKRTVTVELNPAGGLTVTGEQGDLYDARYFNALINPGADIDRLLEILSNNEAMETVVEAARVFSSSAGKFLDKLRRFARRARLALDKEGVKLPGDAIPARKLARIASRLLVNSAKLEGRTYPLVKQVIDGAGLDIRAARQLFDEAIGDHDYAFEMDRATRWLARLLAPTKQLPPLTTIDLPPLEHMPAYSQLLRELPSARELYRAVDSPKPLEPGFSAQAARVAPYLTLEQVEYLLSRGRADWCEPDLRRLGYVAKFKRRVRIISKSYGGIAFIPQGVAIAFFLGEAIALGQREHAGDAGEPRLADTLFGPEDSSILLQASLASVLQGRIEQLNARMLLDHIFAQPPEYLEGVLVELSGRTPSVLAGVLNALLNLDQSCLREPLDMVAECSSRLGVEMPRLDDYLAGGRWAKLSYYEALNQAAEQVLTSAEPYLALKYHLQIDRAPASSAYVTTKTTRPLERRAKQAIASADANGENHAAYQAAFAACAELLEAAPTVFQAPWLKTFWARNFEALVVLSIVRNVQQGIDQTPRWLESRSGQPVPKDEQALVDTVIDVLYWHNEDRERVRTDPLVRLLIDPPPGHYDFTIVSCMGVITEGARGTELEETYHRLEQERGVRTIRADTATARSLEYNALRIEEAVRQIATPWGYIGYSQGCANGLQTEHLLLSGTPEQQAIAARLRARNLLFSSFNGSGHGTSGEWKFLRAVVEGEHFLKHYQAVLSKPAIQLGQRSLRLLLDSQPFVHGMLGTRSLSSEGVRFLQREGQWKGDVPTCYLRGSVEPETLPEVLEWLSNVLTRQLGTPAHDSQVSVDEAVGHPLWLRNEYTAVLERCDMGSLVERTHHWSPLVKETTFVTTERDRANAVYDSPKDRHVFPWIEVNARFGIIKRK